MKFDDHEPNCFESDVHAVPSPHHALSRAARVALTSLVTARRRFSRFTHSRRIRRRAPSVSPALSSPARYCTCSVHGEMADKVKDEKIDGSSVPPHDDIRLSPTTFPGDDFVLPELALLPN